MYRVTSPNTQASQLPPQGGMSGLPGAFASSAVGGYPGALDHTQRLGGFEIEHTPSRMAMRLPEEAPPPRSRDEEEEEEEVDLPTAVGRLFAAKARPFAISGKIPINPDDLTLFFRSQSGATHALEFPIDVEYDTPPALDVLIATCQSTPASSYMDVSGEQGAMIYPPELAYSLTLDLTTRPVLDAVRTALLSDIARGHHLIAVRDHLEVLVTGARRRPQVPVNDGRVATLVLTLPSRHKGGELNVTSSAGGHERYKHKEGKKPGSNIHWVAYLNEGQAEIEPVRKGCRMHMYYAIHLKTFGYSGPSPDPLLTPSDDFKTLLGSVLNLTRGRKVGFYLTRDYGVSPSENIAETLVQMLSGGDALLYHALRAYELAPTLQWTAGGYIWPVDRPVDMSVEPPAGGRSNAPPVRGMFGFSSAPPPPPDEAELLRVRVEAGGGSPLSQADIMVLADWDPSAQGSMTAVGKERVAFVTNGELRKLVVNILLVVYVA